LRAIMTLSINELGGATAFPRSNGGSWAQIGER
jgi:hypothetical protein